MFASSFENIRITSKRLKLGGLHKGPKFQGRADRREARSCSEVNGRTQSPPIAKSNLYATASYEAVRDQVFSTCKEAPLVAHPGITHKVLWIAVFMGSRNLLWAVAT